jgi:hypothetical protein
VARKRRIQLAASLRLDATPAVVKLSHDQSSHDRAAHAAADGSSPRVVLLVVGIQWFLLLQDGISQPAPDAQKGSKTAQISFA